jgi:hypothetical protein
VEIFCGDILLHGKNSNNFSTINNIMNYELFICEKVHSSTHGYSLKVIAFTYTRIFTKSNCVYLHTDIP